MANRLRTWLNSRREHHRCNACQFLTHPRKLQVDHRVPLADGGRDEVENLQVLCVDCHKEKTKREAQARYAKNERPYFG